MPSLEDLEYISTTYHASRYYIQLRYVITFWKWTCTDENDRLDDLCLYFGLNHEPSVVISWSSQLSNATGADSGYSNSKKRSGGVLSKRKQINNSKADSCGFIHICLYYFFNVNLEDRTHLFHTCSCISSGWQPTSLGLFDGFFLWHKMYLRASTLIESVSNQGGLVSVFLPFSKHSTIPCKYTAKTESLYDTYRLLLNVFDFQPKNADASRCHVDIVTEHQSCFPQNSPFTTQNL